MIVEFGADLKRIHSLENNLTIRLLAKKLVRSFDEVYLQSILHLLGDRPGLRGLLFHSVFLHLGEIGTNQIHPQQGLTVEHYRFIFAYFLQHGYRFLRYSDLNNKLTPNGKYIYVTFDDGYYNNINVLPVIEELGIPIHIFVTTRNILDNKKYWWDVVYSFRKKEGLDRKDIEREIADLKELPFDSIERYIDEKFGTHAFCPISDLDRPFTSGELRELSEHKLVTIGNHTQHHAILTEVTKESVKEEIEGAQQDIKAIIGREPYGFAYPNGNYNAQNISVLQSVGIDLAFSCVARNNRIPDDITAEKRFTIGRYTFSANMDLNWQGKIIRAGGSPFLKAQIVMNRLKR